jgi:hypothetical protein
MCNEVQRYYARTAAKMKQFSQLRNSSSVGLLTLGAHLFNPVLASLLGTGTNGTARAGQPISIEPLPAQKER